MDRGSHPSPEPQVGFIPPMLLKRVRQLPEGNTWGYEAKFDGYRMQALKFDGQVRLFSRNGADYTRRFPEVTKAVARLKQHTLHIGGELVAMDQHG